MLSGPLHKRETNPSQDDHHSRNQLILVACQKKKKMESYQLPYERILSVVCVSFIFLDVESIYSAVVNMLSYQAVVLGTLAIQA